MAEFSTIKQIKRFSHSILPGGFLAFLILLLAIVLFSLLIANLGFESFLPIPKRIVSLLEFTLFQAFLSTVFSLILGVLLAWSLSYKNSFKGREILIALLSSSLVLPTLIVVFGLIGILGQNGWLNRALIFLFDFSLGGYVYGLKGILIAHVYLNASFIARGVLHSFESIPLERYKLAKSLGFSTLKRFLLVEFPAIKESLKSMGATVFLLCFTSFAIVLTLGGSPAYNTLEVAIYEAVRLDFDIPFALKLALIQLLVTTFLVLLSTNFKIGSSNIKEQKQKVSLKEPKEIEIFQTFVIVVFSFLFILPLLSIIIDGLGANFFKIFSDKVFIKSFFTSIGIATISSFLSVVISLLISAAKRNFAIQTRLKRTKFRDFINLLISFSTNIYLAIPSLILGLGFFLLGQTYGASQTIVALSALICANVLMSLPFAMSVIYPPMQKIAKRYDRLAFSLGLKGFKRFVFCEWYYIKPTISYVFALSFCLSFGDLGVIALFGNDDITTLPWYLYQLMGSYQSKDGAGVALVLLVLSLSVFIALPKILNRGNHAKN